jgi:hypothetical protein
LAAGAGPGAGRSLATGRWPAATAAGGLGHDERPGSRSGSCDGGLWPRLAAPALLATATAAAEAAAEAAAAEAAEGVGPGGGGALHEDGGSSGGDGADLLPFELACLEVALSEVRALRFTNPSPTI